jgi:hypothetical protein
MSQLKLTLSRPSGMSHKNISPVFGDSEFSIDLPAVSSPDTGKDVEALHEHHMGMFEHDESTEIKSSHSSKGVQQVPTQRPTIIEPRKVTLGQAEKLLSSFRRMATYFPFVQIPAESTVPSLSRTSPFLLLAILTTASIGEPTLYHQMDHEFKRILSSKVIVEGRKSLDFLQGLLIYVAWCALELWYRSSQS